MEKYGCIPISAQSCKQTSGGTQLLMPALPVPEEPPCISQAFRSASNAAVAQNTRLTVPVSEPPVGITPALLRGTPLSDLICIAPPVPMFRVGVTTTMLLLKDEVSVELNAEPPGAAARLKVFPDKPTT